MKRKLGLLLMIVLPFLIGAGCKKDNKETLAAKFEKEFGKLQCKSEPVFGKKDDIVGKWKLVQTWSITGSQNGAAIIDTVDVSCNNVIYEFKADNTLTVTGDKDDVAPGKYTYSYRTINSCPTCLPAPNLRIDNKEGIFAYVYEYKIIMPNVNKAFIRIK